MEKQGTDRVSINIALVKQLNSAPGYTEMETGHNYRNKKSLTSIACKAFKAVGGGLEPPRGS